MLKTVEDYMQHFGPSWRNFSMKVLSQFCKILLHRISNIDPWSSGVALYKLDQDGAEGISGRDVDDHLHSLVRNVIAELSREKVQEILNKSKFAEVLSALGLG